MPIFKIVLTGENFLLRNGAANGRRWCFSATRFVEAEGREEARARAIEVVRRQLAAETANAPDDSPTLYVDSQEELASYDGRSEAGQGFRWAPMDEGAAAKTRFRRRGFQGLFLR